jgi:anti-anti-sigma factor
MGCPISPGGGVGLFPKIRATPEGLTSSSPQFTKPCENNPAVRTIPRKRGKPMPDPSTPPAPTLTLGVDHKAKPIVVKLHGKLVAGVGDTLYREVRPLLSHHKRIILDLGDLVRMDSMGLGMLARLYVSARREGCDLELMKLSKQIHMLLGTAHMLKAFTIVGEHGMKL